MSNEDDIRLLEEVMANTNLTYGGQPLNPIFAKIIHILKNQEPKTNGDRLRAMSDEELAEVITKASDLHKIMCEDAAVGCAFKCKHHMAMCENGGVTMEEKFLKWLKQEVENGR